MSDSLASKIFLDRTAGDLVGIRSHRYPCHHFEWVTAAREIKLQSAWGWGRKGQLLSLDTVFSKMGARPRTLRLHLH